jgi:hypothetical protein
MTPLPLLPVLVRLVSLRALSSYSSTLHKHNPTIEERTTPLVGEVLKVYPAWALGFSERGEVVSRTSPDGSREAFSFATLSDRGIQAPHHNRNIAFASVFNENSRNKNLCFIFPFSIKVFKSS